MNIENILLRSGNAVPRRKLRADFTQTTMNYIAAHPHIPWWSRPKELCMKIFDKPALAVAGAVITLAISGTAYATVSNWAGIHALLTGQIILPNGNRIVQVDTTNCQTINAFTITKPADQRGGPRYFEVFKESKLTNEQIIQLVQGNCEQDAQSQVAVAIQTEAANNPANKDILIGGYGDNVIIAISPTSITLEADIPIGEKLEHVKKTFNHIDPTVSVYYKTEKLAFHDLKVGDHVGFAYRATDDPSTHSEAPPTQLNTDEAIIAVIVKNTQNITAAIDFQKHFGAEFREVGKCDKNPSGYCTFEEIQNK